VVYAGYFNCPRARREFDSDKPRLVFEVTFAVDVRMAEQVSRAPTKEYEPQAWGTAWLSAQKIDSKYYDERYSLNRALTFKFGENHYRQGLVKDYTKELLLLNCEDFLYNVRCIEPFGR
jgi:hypothetical protein